ncbi:HPP family protein [Zooshikella marina]|nr:HPP family protein [Zooshikella ganghwensis]MBU2708071.1 HPP family protein [Zooshikella ganghwensis]
MISNVLTRWPAVTAGIGAMLCITALGSLDQAAQPLAWLMAPYGATMVILFGLPDSPLAQPRNIILGHLMTTLIGLVMVNMFEVNAWTMGAAVGLAVAFMILTKTTHPPAGANPLLVMLTGESWMFLFNPVLIGTLLIVTIGVVYHRWICKRVYPIRWL